MAKLKKEMQIQDVDEKKAFLEKNEFEFDDGINLHVNSVKTLGFSLNSKWHKADLGKYIDEQQLDLKKQCQLKIGKYKSNKGIEVYKKNIIQIGDGFYDCGFIEKGHDILNTFSSIPNKKIEVKLTNNGREDGPLDRLTVLSNGMDFAYISPLDSSDLEDFEPAKFVLLSKHFEYDENVDAYKKKNILVFINPKSDFMRSKPFKNTYELKDDEFDKKCIHLPHYRKGYKTINLGERTYGCSNLIEGKQILKQILKQKGVKLDKNPLFTIKQNKENIQLQIDEQPNYSVYLN